MPYCHPGVVTKFPGRKSPSFTTGYQMPRTVSFRMMHGVPLGTEFLFFLQGPPHPLRTPLESMPMANGQPLGYPQTLAGLRPGTSWGGSSAHPPTQGGGVLQT